MTTYTFIPVSPEEKQNAQNLGKALESIGFALINAGGAALSEIGARIKFRGELISHVGSVIGNDVDLAKVAVEFIASTAGEYAARQALAAAFAQNSAVLASALGAAGPAGGVAALIVSAAIYLGATELATAAAGGLYDYYNDPLQSIPANSQLIISETGNILDLVYRVDAIEVKQQKDLSGAFNWSVHTVVTQRGNPLYEIWQNDDGSKLQTVWDRGEDDRLNVFVAEFINNNGQMFKQIVLDPSGLKTETIVDISDQLWFRYLYYGESIVDQGSGAVGDADGYWVSALDDGYQYHRPVLVERFLKNMESTDAQYVFDYRAGVVSSMIDGISAGVRALNNPGYEGLANGLDVVSNNVEAYALFSGLDIDYIEMSSLIAGSIAKSLGYDPGVLAQIKFDPMALQAASGAVSANMFAAGAVASFIDGAAAYSGPAMSNLIQDVISNSNFSADFAAFSMQNVNNNVSIMLTSDDKIITTTLDINNNYEWGFQQTISNDGMLQEQLTRNDNGSETLNIWINTPVAVLNKFAVEEYNNNGDMTSQTVIHNGGLGTRTVLDISDQAYTTILFDADGSVMSAKSGHMSDGFLSWTSLSGDDPDLKAVVSVASEMMSIHTGSGGVIDVSSYQTFSNYNPFGAYSDFGYWGFGGLWLDPYHQNEIHLPMTYVIP